MGQTTPYMDLTTPYKVESSPAMNDHHETGVIVTVLRVCSLKDNEF